MTSEVFNTDGLDYMRTLPDKAFQLAIADPPYGLDPSASETWSDKSALKNRAWSKGKIGESWDKAPEQDFFDEHLDKHNRMPTFLDAIEYGMEIGKKKR